VKTPKPAAPPAVSWIAKTLEAAGYETWAVGGAVRDVLRGRSSGDWDLATRARPQEVRRLFKRTVPIGVEHGTVGVLARDGTLYEVTTFRRDVETDGRHAVVQFADDIHDDLSRRDFTVNAIAWHPLREELLDPFGGVADLKAHVLRTVGSPADRFREDYLRILRALRFAGLFSLDIESDTWEALRRLADHLTSLSAERIRDELVKVLDQDAAPARALELYADSGALGILYPELDRLRIEEGKGAGAGPWRLSVETVQQLPPGRPMLRLAALLREVEPAEVAAMLLRLRFSNAIVDETAHRASALPLPGPDAEERAFRGWLSATGAERLAALARLDLARAEAECRLGIGDHVADVVASWRHAQAVKRAAPPLTVGDLALDGRGLISLGLKPGPSFGRILEELLEWVLEDPARNQRDALAARALELYVDGVTDG
jgi:tRNA nucleotidyltransferase (CCA-adding enzyme)